MPEPVDECAPSRRNKKLREAFGKVLRELGQEILPEDGLVAGYFLHTDKHVSIEDICHALREKHPGIDIPHVRRAMRLLCDLGVAQQLRLKGETVYEHLHLDSHHDHLVCVRCGAIVEFHEEEIEQRQKEICRGYGFTPLMHKLEIRGVCRQCAENTPATRTLAACLAGEEVEIAEVVGGRELRHRLTSLGLVRGTRIRILSADGPVALDIRGSRIAIGVGQAAKVIVRNNGED